MSLVWSNIFDLGTVDLYAFDFSLGVIVPAASISSGSIVASGGSIVCTALPAHTSLYIAPQGNVAGRECRLTFSGVDLVPTYTVTGDITGQLGAGGTPMVAYTPAAGTLNNLAVYYPDSVTSIPQRVLVDGSGDPLLFSASQAVIEISIGETQGNMTVLVEAGKTYPAPCDEIGRVTKAYVSQHYRTRVHDSRLMLGEKRCMVVELNGALSSGRTISSVTWRCEYPYIAIMANARIQEGQRSAAIDLTANWIGDTTIQCEATLDNGEVYTQMFRVAVSGNPWYLPTQSSSGPTTLTAS